VPLRRTLIASTRARPARISRSIRRVFSCVRTVPMTGSLRWRRSDSTRIAPVVNDTRSASRPFFLNLGEPDAFSRPGARPGLLPVPVRLHRTIDTVGIDLFRALGPPHLTRLGVDAHLALGLVRPFAQHPQRRLVRLGTVLCSAFTGKCGFNILRTEPAEPIPVLDHDPRDRRIAQQSEKLSAVPVQRGPDFGDDLVDRHLLGRGPRRHARHLSI
jgi:hypothetical protein